MRTHNTAVLHRKQGTCVAYDMRRLMCVNEQEERYICLGIRVYAHVYKYKHIVRVRTTLKCCSRNKLVAYDMLFMCVCVCECVVCVNESERKRTRIDV